MNQIFYDAVGNNPIIAAVKVKCFVILMAAPNPSE